MTGIKRSSLFTFWISLSLSMVLIISGCSSPLRPDDFEDAKINDISSTLTFDKISRQGFMGGSVLYNPDKPTTGQLANGVSIAVRLGKARCITKTPEQTAYADIPEETKFGSLYITGINENSIDFRVSLFDVNGNNLGTNSYHINKGEQIDINSDNVPDLEYAAPKRKRANLQNAVYLNFLSSKEAATTTMFAVLKEQYPGRTYPSGLIGINPDERFIIRKYSDDKTGERSIVHGVQNGDFVLDSIEGRYQRVVNFRHSGSIRTISNECLEDIHIREFNANSSSSFTNEDFAGLYNAEKLISALPPAIKDKMPGSTPAVEKLNQILNDRNLIKEVAAVQKTAIPDKIFKEVEAQTATASTEDLIKLNRRFLEKTFPDLCPEYIGDSISYSEILPLASVSLGAPNNNNNNNSNNRVLAINNNENKHAANFEEYKAQRAAFETEYKTYTEIMKFPLTMSFDSGKEKKDDKKEENKEEKKEDKKDDKKDSGKTSISISLSDSYIALGIRGDYTSTWGSFNATLEGAVYIQVESDIKSEINFEKNLFSKEFESPSCSIDIYGPIILNIKNVVSIDVPLKISTPASATSDFKAAACGLYGAGFNINMDYAVKWESFWFLSVPVPYAETKEKAWTVGKTAYFAGTNMENSRRSVGVKVSIVPTVKDTVEFDIDKIVGGGISIAAGVRTNMGVMYTDPYIAANVDIIGELNLGANAFIGIKALNFVHGAKEWKWEGLEHYEKPLASWELFKIKLP